MPHERPAQAAATSDAFARLLGVREDARPLLGIEHEFVVRGPDGTARDFRTLIHRLGVPGRRLDPGDANAYRLHWGGALTSDGPEAEIATPPVTLEPGAVSRAARLASNATASLAELLPDGLVLEGYSTHISVSARDDLLPRMAALYARTFATPLMLLTDRAESPGVLIRPRPGRLELCLEHVAYDRLAAAAMFAAGSVAAVARAVVSGSLDGLPPEIALAIAPATSRFGWFVDRRATGADLHARGRDTELFLEPDGRTTAAAYLRMAWSHARAAAAEEGITDDDARATLDQLVSGEITFPCEVAEGGTVEVTLGSTPADRDPLGDLLRPRQRPPFAIEAVWSTWDHSIFRFRSRSRHAYACVPRASLARFLRLADAGELDDVVLRYLDAANGARPLLEAGQTGEPGLYDVVGPSKDLLPQEPGLGFTGGGPRRGKRRRHDERRHHGRQHVPSTPDAPKQGVAAAKASGMSTRSKVVVAAATAALVAAGAIAFAASSGRSGAAGPQGSVSSSLAATGSSGPSATVSPTPTAPPATGQAHVTGTYAYLGGSSGSLPSSLTFVSSCAEGPCAAKASGTTDTYHIKLSFPTAFSGGTYTGTAHGNPGCPPPPDTPNRAWPISYDVKLHVLKAKMLDGVWTAVLVGGTIHVQAPLVTTFAGGTNHRCNKANFTSDVTYKRKG
jgi:hypothetical protein